MMPHSQDQKEVVFISTPAMGMLPPTVEFARRLVLHPGLSATVLLLPVPESLTIHSYTQSLLATSSPNLRFHLLPPLHPPAPDHQYLINVSSLVNAHRSHVKTALLGLLKRRVVAGLFVDMFSTSVIGVANDLGISSYLFFASPAGFLSFMLAAPSLDSLLASDSVAELSVPGFVNSVPRRVLPTAVLKRGDEYFKWLEHAKRYVETNGIVVNTVKELEPFILDSLRVSPGSPKIYPVGPLLNLDGLAHRAEHESVMTWLDRQPETSVVFLCFGSMGRSHSKAQVRELAVGLKQARVRFLWSCPDKPKIEMCIIPCEYSSLEQVLPDGFLEETDEIGLVCGWVPQVAILGHRAIGGFVSHCGWNSILESLWHGVPIAAWPLYAEQQMNAFELLREYGLAVEIRMDYRGDGDLVTSEEVERGVKRLMMKVGNEELRAKVKAMSGNIRMALMEGGSSSESLDSLVAELVANC